MNKKSFLEKIATLSKVDQIQIVLSGFPGEELTEDEFLDGDYSQSANLEEKASSLSVTAQEIRDYVKEFGFPRSCVIGTTADTLDGTYIVEENKEFHLYAMERGCKQNERIFNSYQEAIEQLVEDHIELYLSLKTYVT